MRGNNAQKGQMMNQNMNMSVQPEIMQVLKRDIQNFRGGNLKNHLKKWKNVASDKIILDIIGNGVKLDLIDTPKFNHYKMYKN